jgi:hypothetical protein
MSVRNILEALDQEIANLTQARTVLARLGSVNGSASHGVGKRVFSAAARRKMAASQKARWAKYRGDQNGGTKGARVMSPSARRKISAAQKARWAKFRGSKRAK